MAQYEVFLPRVRERRVQRGKFHLVVRSLFPNYLFVRIANGWWDARWCVGISGLIMSHDRPAAVDDNIIDEIRARERAGFVELPEKPRFVRGDRVRITQGALFGQVGLYDGMRGDERCWVLLRMFGSQQRVDLAADAITEAGST
jgi:transcription antitermination factor NusG